jgi:hypothetical protein
MAGYWRGVVSAKKEAPFRVARAREGERLPAPRPLACRRRCRRLSIRSRGPSRNPWRACHHCGGLLAHAVRVNSLLAFAASLPQPGSAAHESLGNPRALCCPDYVIGALSLTQPST